MTAQGWIWAAGGSLAVALFAGLADWRRGRRPDLDRVGWVPWAPLQFIAFIAALAAIALAMKG